MSLTSPEFRERLKRLRLNAERMRAKHIVGNRRVSKLGSGLEFAGHRQYTPGDDLRFLDWNALGRLEQMVLKVFDAPNELTVVIALDQSATLGFGTPPKVDRLKEIGAAIGYLALSSGDRVVLAPISGGGKTRSFNSLNQEGNFLRALDGDQPAPEVKLEPWLASVMKQRGDVMLVLLTDFQAQEATRRIIQEANSHHIKVLALQGWAPEEVHPELDGECIVQALQSQGSTQSTKVTVTPDLLKRYQEEIQQWRQAIGNFCRRLGVPHLEFTTEHRMEEVVIGLVNSGIVRVAKG